MNAGQLVNLNDRLVALGTIVEGTNLVLLREVEKTVDTLQALEKTSDGIAKMALGLATEINCLKVATPGQLIDPDDKVVDGLDASIDSLEDLLPKFLLAASALQGDPKFVQSRDLLEVAFERHAAALAGAIEASKTLVAAIIAFNLKAESKPTVVFNTAEALVADLHKTSLV